MSTAGIKSSGSDFSGLNDILKQVYEPTLQNLIVSDSEVHDVFHEVSEFEHSDGPDGKQINIGVLLQGGGGWGAIDEDGYLPSPSLPSSKQMAITLKQFHATVELSGRTLRRAKAGAAAFVTWADEQLPLAIQRHVHHKDRMLIGAGTGAVALVNDATPAANDLDIDSAFGIAGLPGANMLVMEGDSLRAATDVAGATARTGAMIVQTIGYGTDDITVDALATALADNDVLFVGDANGYGNGSKEAMGLEGHVDNGTNVATYQGLSRTTYPRLKAQELDASGGTFAGVLSEEVLEKADRLAWTRGKGKPSVLVCSYEARAAFWKSLKSDRMLVNPDGKYQGGFREGDLGVILGNRVVKLRACRKVPYSRAYFVDPSSLKMYRNGAGAWDDTAGSIWNRVTNSTGRRDAWYATFIEEFEVGGRNPQANVRITGLASGE